MRDSCNETSNRDENEYYLSKYDAYRLDSNPATVEVPQGRKGIKPLKVLLTETVDRPKVTQLRYFQNYEDRTQFKKYYHDNAIGMPANFFAGCYQSAVFDVGESGDDKRLDQCAYSNSYSVKIGNFLSIKDL